MLDNLVCHFREKFVFLVICTVIRLVFSDHCFNGHPGAAGFSFMMVKRFYALVSKISEIRDLFFPGYRSNVREFLFYKVFCNFRMKVPDSNQSKPFGPVPALVETFKQTLISIFDYFFGPYWHAFCYSGSRKLKA